MGSTDIAGSVTIPSRFNGPLDSGQGGYSAGIVAAFVDGVAEVSLRRPLPLERPLDVVRDGDGSVRLLDGDALVADARPAGDLGVEVPSPVGVDQAREATSRYRGQARGPFSRCFVCGLGREDCLHVFAGEVPGRRLLATPWTAPAWTADATGSVRPELVWAVLDCPATFATLLDGVAEIAFLAQFAVRIDAPVRAGTEHVIIGWPRGVDGRKRHAASALLAADGTVLAVGRALLIEPRREPAAAAGPRS